MGDAIKGVDKKRRSLHKESHTMGLRARKDIRKANKPVRTKIHQKAEAGVRTGKSAAARDAASDVQKQQQMEAVKLAEAEGEIERTKVAGRRGGRRSLIKSAGAGLSTNLGGTA